MKSLDDIRALTVLIRFKSTLFSYNTSFPCAINISQLYAGINIHEEKLNCKQNAVISFL